MTWDEFRGTVEACRGGIRKAKAHLQLNLARDVKGNKKGIYGDMGSKRKPSENMGPLLNGAGDLETKSMGKAKVLKALLAW